MTCFFLLQRIGLMSRLCLAAFVHLVRSFSCFGCRVQAKRVEWEGLKWFTHRLVHLDMVVSKAGDPKSSNLNIILNGKTKCVGLSHFKNRPCLHLTCPVHCSVLGGFEELVDIQCH